MKWIFIPVTFLLLGTYTALNYYIGLRGAQAFGMLLGSRGLAAYWVVFWAFVYLYLAARFLHRVLPATINRWMVHAGSYWLAALVYFLGFIVMIDIIRALLIVLSVNLPIWTWQKPLLGSVVVLLVAGILIYGTYNARNPRTVRYQIDLSPACETDSVDFIEVALVSDIHLGTIVRTRQLEFLVSQLNGLNPDLILFAGDLIDENVNHFIDEGMDEYFKKLNPPLGKYAVLGNHEYYGGHLEEIVKHLEQSGVQVLRDEGVMVKDAFYLAGREDLTFERQGRTRKSLDTILAEIDPAQVPVVLMDHQPKTWQEAKDAGVLLQVSGHTHRGQLFPFGWITERIFEEDWGMLTENGQTLIVSSGYGTWGPPIRTGNRPEIVVISLKYGRCIASD
jgi:uncharacterized protein